jgi:hypothetical protein
MAPERGNLLTVGRVRHARRRESLSKGNRKIPFSSLIVYLHPYPIFMGTIAFYE